MLVSAIIKAILFYVLFRVVKNLLAYNDKNSFKNRPTNTKNNKPGAHKKGEVIGAEYRVIK